MQRICVFCGSNTGGRPSYAALARALGGELARRKIGLVFGGGRVGLMGAIADATLEAGGEVIGVIPRALATKELAHDRVTTLHVVDSMHQRKAKMAELADGFIALPGGLGTLEELFEVLTWAQLGIHAKPVGLLDADDYYAPLLHFLDHARDHGFIRPEHRGLLLGARAPAALLAAMASWRAPTVPKWLDPAET
ncbi:MAG TPA: TIGR00730 family Rossman fold protein [Kofleriaceae bacterium]|nr:TIGR00730 family Rossman fold protein [Kofleriaceae bacterium]